MAENVGQKVFIEFDLMSGKTHSAELPATGVIPPRGAYAYRFFMRRAGVEATSHRVPSWNQREYLPFDPDSAIKQGNGIEGYIGKIIPINDEISRLSVATNEDTPSSINGTSIADQLRLLREDVHENTVLSPKENLFVLILLSPDNPKISGIDDTEVVGDRIPI